MTVKKYIIINEGSSFPQFFSPGGEHSVNAEPDTLQSIPAVNIYEHKGGYTVLLAAPGLEKDDFKIDENDAILSVRAQKKRDCREEDQKYTRKEFNYSSFTSSFRLPDDVNLNNIEASYENGILKLSIPRR